MPHNLSADVLTQQESILKKELAKSRENEARLEKILSHYTSLPETALKESEKKYRMLFESMRNGIVFLEAIYDDAGKVCDARYVEMNAVYQQYTGLNREKAIGRTVMEMLPDTQTTWFDTLDIAIKKGKLIRFEMYHEGTQKHYAVSAYSPDKNMVVGVFRNITPEKEMAKALKQNEEKYRLIVENQKDLVVKVDTDGTFLFVSPSYCKMFGKAEDALLGKKILSMVVEDLESTANAMANLYRLPYTVHFEQRALTASEWRWFDWVYTAVLDKNHQVVSIIGVGRDINDKKLAEQEKLEMQEKLNRSKKMEAMGLMAGGVAHDLNNILSSVISYPELMLMNPLFPDNFRRPVERIKEGGLRAAAIVADLLTIARGVASRKEVGNINDIISVYLNSFEHMEMLETCHGISIEKSLDSHLHNITCSPVHVRKVLMNLVINAIESVKPAGKIMISTRNESLDKPLQGYDDVRAGAYAVLSVADSGAGISSEDMEHIFEPFYSKKKMGRSGTGLGLTVVWNTVQDHQGYINVYSGTAGARFDLYFPASGQASTDTAESVDRAYFKGTGQRVLVVDDEESQQEIALQILTELGYLVETVGSGEKALAYLQDNAVDLVVLDMIMGSGMNGCQTYQEIVRIRPGQKAIIASGFAETADVREAQRIGAGAFVKKPYTIDRIGIAIKAELLK